MHRVPLPDHPFDWRVLRSHYALRDRWIAVRSDTVQMPNGQVLDPFYILEYPDYINVVALTPDQQVVLIREYRHGAARTILELPSGVVDGEEPPLETARRELLEETGYGGGEWQQVGRVSPNPGNHTNLTYTFLARGVTRQQAQQLESGEQIEVLLLPVQAVIEQLRDNQFLQALHVSGLFYAFQALGMIQFSANALPDK